MREFLIPLSWLFGVVVAIRNKLFDIGIFRVHDSGLPVISVGNIVTGGTGKTPCVVAIVELLLREGRRPAVVSRGYGREGSGTVVVSNGSKVLVTARESGDEAMLVAQRFPGVIVVVAERRIDAALAARRLGADCVVADDAFQHRSLRRMVDVVMSGSEYERPEIALLPAGNGREPIRSLGRATIVISTSPEEEIVKSHVARVSIAKLLFADIVPVDVWRPLTNTFATLDELNGKQIFLATGIAHPERVSETLVAIGATIGGKKNFPDHYWFSELDAIELVELAAKYKSIFVTTEKDWIRLAALHNSSVVFGKVDVVVVRVAMKIRKDGKEFDELMLAQLKSESGRS